MLELSFKLPADRPPRFLFLGAHCDDIEIGCGGTVLEMLQRYPEAEFHWVVFSAGEKREAEAREAAHKFLGDEKQSNVIVKDFRGAYFPDEWAGIKDYIETLKPIQPDVVFVHTRDELHQDHRVLGELVWNSFRDHLVLEYEIPKFDGGLGSPSVFVPVSHQHMQQKVNVLMQVFKTQHDKQWFTPETFTGLMRLRGIECNSAHGYAEAFYCRKAVLG